jgi:hypothetical protein
MSGAQSVGNTGIFTVDDGTASAQQAFAFPTSLHVSSGAVSDLDASYMSQTDKSKILKPGMREPLNLEGECFLTNTDFTRFRALLGVIKVFAFTTMVDGGDSPVVETYNGYLKDFDFEMKTNELVKVKHKWTASGDKTS